MVLGDDPRGGPLRFLLWKKPGEKTSFKKSGKKLIVNGLNNYIIAEKNNTLLIYPKEKDQEIGNL